MKLLLGCVNSDLSLIGFDWDKGEVFWSCPQTKLKVCGICYDGPDLLISTDDFLTRVTPSGYIRTRLNGRHEALSHSVHVIEDDLVGIVDTGNTRVVGFNRKGEQEVEFEPLKEWGEIPKDAIHLNDFAVTASGILASSFDYRPWRQTKEDITWDDWCTGGYGVILNLTGNGVTGKGRIVGCGFNHPHSLNFVDPYLYLCSSATGIFHKCEIDDTGVVREKDRFKVSQDHFLRGAHKMGTEWFLGGSAVRHGQGVVLSQRVVLYRLDEETGKVENRTVLWGHGEIYDVLPWRDEVMEPLIRKHFSETVAPVQDRDNSAPLETRMGTR